MQYSIIDNLIVVKNNTGLEMKLSPFGASLYDIIFDDKHMMINYAIEEDFKSDKSAYFGKIVGPFAGRVKKGEYHLDGKTYNLPINEGNVSLHSGDISYAFKRFNFACDEKEEYFEVSFSLDFKEYSNYPSNGKIEVIYRLANNDNVIRCIIKQNTSKRVPTNIISHGYFNLGGSEDVLFHKLYINSSRVMKYDDDLIGLGFIEADNVMSFKKPKYLMEDISKITHPRFKGYDHTYAFDKLTKKEPELILESARYLMKLFTDTSGVHIYTDNFPRENTILNTGFNEKAHSAIAIEPMDVYGSIDETLTDTYKKSFKLVFEKK